MSDWLWIILGAALMVVGIVGFFRGGGRPEDNGHDRVNYVDPRVLN